MTTAKACFPPAFIERLRPLVCSLLLVVGPPAGVRTANADTIPFERARSLATNICSQCHLFPEPNVLDKATWRDKVKPLMRTTMNLAAIENDPSPNSRILMKEWEAIWNDFYLAAAPEKALPQDPRPPIVPDLTLFKVEDPHYQVTNGFTTLV